MRACVSDRPVEYHSVVGVSGMLNVLRVALSKKSRLREPTMGDRNVSGGDLIAPGTAPLLSPLYRLHSLHRCTVLSSLSHTTLYNLFTRV